MRSLVSLILLSTALSASAFPDIFGKLKGSADNVRCEVCQKVAEFAQNQIHAFADNQLESLSESNCESLPLPFIRAPCTDFVQGNLHSAAALMINNLSAREICETLSHCPKDGQTTALTSQ